MKWCKGSHYQQKLNTMIEEIFSNHQESVFFCKEDSIVDYERRILTSSSQAVCFHLQITSLERYCYEVLRKHHLFLYQPLTTIDLYILVKEALQTLSLSLFKNTEKNSGLVQEIITALKEIDSYQLLHIEHYQELYSFSKVKLEELLLIYQYVMSHKSKYQLFNDEIYRITKKYFDTTLFYYMDGVEQLTPAQKELLQPLKGIVNITTYTDTSSDAINYGAGYQAHIQDNYLKKEIEGKENSNFKFFKANNKQQEVEEIASCIYQKLVEEDAKYQDFMVYMTDQSYLPIIKDVFKRFDIAFHSSLRSTFKESRIYQLLALFFCYYKEEEDEFLIKMLYCLYHKDSIDLLHHIYIQSLEITHPKFISFKEAVKEIKQQFQQANTMAGFSKVLFDWLTSEKIHHSFIGEEESYLSVVRYLDEFLSKKFAMTAEDFIDLFDSYFTAGKNQPNYVDSVQVFHLLENSAMVLQPNYLFVLGCSENNFPNTIKDTGLLLDEDRIVLRKYYPSLPLVREQVEDSYTLIFKIINQAPNIHFSYPTGSYKNEEFLPSLLYMQLLKMTKQEEASIDSSWKPGSKKQYHKDYFLRNNLPYQEDYLTPQGNAIKKIIEDFKVTKNHPMSLDEGIITKLYSKETGLYTSSSQLETYNGCPYRHFLNYGLKVFPLKARVIELSDIGTLQHAIMEALEPLYSSKEATKQVSSLEQLLKQYQIQSTSIVFDDLLALITKMIKQHINENNLLQKKIENDYTSQMMIKRIIHSTINNVLVLMYHSQLSKFKVLQSEAWTSKQRNHQITLSGKVDRIDEYEGYIKVLDYKSSNKALDLGLAMQGFNMQMLVYLDMLSSSLEKKKGGVVYFDLSNRVIKAKKKISLEKEAFEDVMKEYKMQGYLVNDSKHIVISGTDEGYMQGSSSIINMRYVKSTAQHTGNLMTEDEMEQLITYINERIDTMIEEIFIEGNISITPSSHESSAVKMKVHPCRYCDYKEVCQKDVFYNEERMVINYNKEDVIKMLRGEENEEN